MCYHIHYYYFLKSIVTLICYFLSIFSFPWTHENKMTLYVKLSFKKVKVMLAFSLKVLIKILNKFHG